MNILTNSVSLHIKRPKALQVPLNSAFSAAMHDITDRRSNQFGAAFIGLNDYDRTTYFTFGVADKAFSPNNQHNDSSQNIITYSRGTINSVIVDVRVDDHAIFGVSEQTFTDIKSYLVEKANSPPDYHPLQNNCVAFALAALEVGGIKLDTSVVTKSVAKMRRPQDVTTVLENHPPQDNAIIVTGKPIILGVDQLPITPQQASRLKLYNNSIWSA